MKRNKITKVFRNLALGLAITASGLILETPAHAEGRYWYSDQGKYTDEQHAYTYLSVGGDMITTDDLNLARKYAIGEIQTKDGVLQNTQEDRNKVIEQEKINKQLEMQKPENQPISYEEFTRIANEEMLRLVNKHREENGLNPLEYDETLAKMATEKSEHMITHNYFSHVYKGVETRYVQAKEKHTYVLGENCLVNSNYPITEKGAKDMATSMFYQWRCSPGHNKNMLYSNNTLMGFGFAFTGNTLNDTSYATQIFSDSEHLHDDYYIDYETKGTKYNSLSDLDNM